MSFTARYVGQLVHENIERDALKLAKAAGVQDTRPWPEDVVFSEPESGWYEARTAEGRLLQAQTSPFDEDGQEFGLDRLIDILQGSLRITRVKPCIGEVKISFSHCAVV